MKNINYCQLNVAKGNMYDFVSHTWNPIKGRCYHQCKYCYMNKLLIPKYQCEPIIVEHEFEKNLDEGKLIFVGSSIDMFAKDIADESITRVLNYCAKANEQKKEGQKKIVFLFQSKDPARILQFISHPVFKHSIIATTLESNRNYYEFYGNSPSIRDRVAAMEIIAQEGLYTMVTAEPLMDFDLADFVELIRRCKPHFINIGRNTQRSIPLPEPNAEKVKELIYALKDFTKVKIKSNAKCWE